MLCTRVGFLLSLCVSVLWKIPAFSFLGVQCCVRDLSAFSYGKDYCGMNLIVFFCQVIEEIYPPSPVLRFSDGEEI